MSILHNILGSVLKKPEPSVKVEMMPTLSADDDLLLKGLQRVMAEYTALPRHAALKLGVVVPGKRASVEVLVLKPCLKGMPRARTSFFGSSVAEAAHSAKLFVESILPCDEETDK